MELQTIWQEYDFETLQRGMRNLFPEYDLSLEKLLQFVLQGDFKEAIHYLWSNTMGGVTAQVGALKQVLILMLILGIISALLTHFIDVFDKKQVADLGFYYTYLLMSTVLLKCFSEAAKIATTALEHILLFVKLLMPTYLLAVGFSTGTKTAGAGSQLLVLASYGVETFLQSLIFPLIYGYFMFSIVNCIWADEKLVLLMELMKKISEWGLKAALGVVTGMGVFQSAIMPILDSVKGNALQRVLSALPGVGNLSDGVVELVAGSAMMIKNSLGVILMLLLLVLCFTPLLQIFLIALLLKASAALMGIVSDKRLTACADHVGDAALLLFRTTATAMLLFLLILAIMTMLTRG